MPRPTKTDDALAWARPARARAALARFAPRYQGGFRHVNTGENATWRVDAPAGRFALRLYRPTRWTPDQIQVEHDFMRFLGSRLNVVPPVKGRDGESLQLAAGEPAAALFPWAPGRFVAGRSRPLHLRRVGDYLGRLHHRSLRFVPGGRRLPCDVGETLLRPAARLATEGRRLLPRHRGLADLETRAATVLERIRAFSPETGFLHADLHFGNLTMDRGEVHPIDFDDCGPGPLAYELGVVAYYVVGRPEGDAYVDALVDGYAGSAPRPLGITPILLFSWARVLWILDWVLDRPEIFTRARQVASMKRNLRLLGLLDRKLARTPGA